MKLAIPRKFFKDKKLAWYFYDDKGEQGRKEEFKTACPAYTDQQETIEIQWRKTANASQGSTLFFLQEYTNQKMICETFERPVPSIQKKDGECGKSQGEIYEVGYSVNNINFFQFKKLKNYQEFTTSHHLGYLS